MTIRKSNAQAGWLLSLAMSVGVLVSSRDARAAITCGETATCSTAGGPALKIVNSSGAPNGVGIVIDSTGGVADAINAYAPDSHGAAGVYGTGYYGVYGVGSSGYGVYGFANTGIAVYGIAQAGTGVSGVSQAATGTGVLGSAWRGIYGNSTSTGPGVQGQSKTGGKGVQGVISPAGTGYGVYGDNNSTTGYAGYFRGRLQVTGDAICPSCSMGLWKTSSDARLKKNVKPLTGALDRVLQLRAVTFEWNNPEEHGNHTGLQRGFIAQDVEKVLPEWVGTDDNGFKTLDLNGIDALLVESVRTLKQENNELRSRLTALEERRGAPSAWNGNTAGFAFTGLALFAAVAFSRRRNPPMP